MDEDHMLEPLDHSDTESAVNAISDLYVCISTINSSNSILGQKTQVKMSYTDVLSFISLRYS